MNATVTVRRGEHGDRPFVLDLGRRVAQTSVSSLRTALPPLVESAFRSLTEYTWTRDCDTLIAEVAGRPLGFVLLIYDLPDEVSLTQQAFIAYMAVEPEAQRQGIGSALLDEVERLTTERGIGHISLMVTEENDAARELYASAGFVTERRMLTKEL